MREDGEAVNACARCGIRAARGRPYDWRPELCGPCAEEIKHPTMRGASDWVTPEQRQSANRMLTELRRFQIPPDWLADAAEHVAKRTGESVEDVLRRWNAGQP